MLQKKNGLIFSNGVLEEGAVELSPTELTNYKKENLKNNLISVRRSYLFSTDWYTSRAVDEPNSYPEEIKNKRILARQEINDIEACTTLAALEQFKTF